MREREMLYAGCWLERFARPLGSTESIERIVQDDAQLYYDTHYIPANMSVVGVGGMSFSELVKLISESPFSVNKSGARTVLPLPVTERTFPAENRYIFEMS